MKRILQRALVSRRDGEATLAGSISSSVSSQMLTLQSQQVEPSVGAEGPLGSQLEHGHLYPSHPRGHEPTAGIRAAGGEVGSAGPKALLHILAD